MGNNDRQNGTKILVIAVITTLILMAFLLIGLNRQSPSDEFVPDESSLQGDVKSSFEYDDDNNNTALPLPTDSPSVIENIAEYEDMSITSPIRAKDLTGVLFHQASYDYGLQLSTSLPEADVSTVRGSDNGVYVNHNQEDGDWLDTEALHLTRSQGRTRMDTAIDVGADAGTPVYAPLSGTVVLVKPYKLYGRIDDYEIHIQPDNHPDLDCVLIHVDDVLVQPGDEVEAGMTQLARVRDLSSVLDGIQLDDYDGSQHHGNHTHLQLNDANYPNYRSTKLDGALMPSD